MENVTNLERERMMRRALMLLDPDVYEARAAQRRAGRQAQRDLAYLGRVAAVVVGGALFALCVIAVVWGVA